MSNVPLNSRMNCHSCHKRGIFDDDVPLCVTWVANHPLTIAGKAKKQMIQDHLLVCLPSGLIELVIDFLTCRFSLHLLWWIEETIYVYLPLHAKCTTEKSSLLLERRLKSFNPTSVCSLKPFSIAKFRKTCPRILFSEHDGIHKKDRKPDVYVFRFLVDQKNQEPSSSCHWKCTHSEMLFQGSRFFLMCQTCILASKWDTFFGRDRVIKERPQSVFMEIIEDYRILPHLSKQKKTG